MASPDKAKRLLYLDIARGFAVIFMFTQHCMLVHEAEAGESGHLLSLIFTLAGTAPAAPVFMMLMGVFQMKSRASVKAQILRGVKLFALGLLLNLLRLPLMISEGTDGGVLIGETLFHVLVFNDILQLAGLSYIVGALIKPLMDHRFIPPLLFSVICLISPLLWGLFPGNPLLMMLRGRGELVNFPFFPWIIYPLMGMYLSPFLTGENETPDKSLNRMAAFGLLFIAVGELLVFFELLPVGDYSRSGLGVHLLITGFVFIWLKLCRYMEKSVSRESRLIRVLSFLSLNTTTVYFIQWILFAWSIIPLGANQQNPYMAALIGLVVFLMTWGLIQLKAVRNPFSFTAVKKAQSAVQQIQLSSIQNDLSDMSIDEIESEIRTVRKDRKK